MRRAATIALLLPVLAGGCGSSGGSSSKTAAPSSAPATTQAASLPVVKTVSIFETEFKLSPKTLSFSKPGTYVLKGVNRGTTKHGLAVQGNGVDVASTPVGPGKTTVLKVTLTKPGTYTLYCPVDSHENQGMRATIRLVGAAAPGPTTTPAQPTTTSGGGNGSGRGY